VSEAADAGRVEDLAEALGAAVERATGGAWRTARVYQERDRLYVSLAPSGVVLEIRAARDGARAYRQVADLSFAYRGDQLDGATLSVLDGAIDALASVLTAARFDPRRDVLRTREEREVGFPTPYHRAHLGDSVALPKDVIETYRRDGHVLVRRALAPAVVRAAWPVLTRAIERGWPQDQLPMDERPDAYSRAFTQITDLGSVDPVVRLFSNARRIARMAADLMGVDALRLFCEDWLIKEPGARITPWHQDAAVFPFDAEATLTAWIPLRDLGPGEGLLRFARGAHSDGLAEIEGIHDESEEGYAAIIEERGYPIDVLPPVFAGDVSFHDGRLIHGAFENRGEAHRAVLALHFFADGARIKQGLTPTMMQTLRDSAPERKPGDPAQADAWPIVLGPGATPLPRISSAGDVMKPARLRATLLPEGEEKDLLIVDGLIRFGDVEGASGFDELALAGGYVCSGLVEAHGHISYSDDREDPVGEVRWMNARRADYAETGVTLIRDMGAHDDAINALADVPGLPRVHGSGTMILRKGEWPFTHTAPADLVRACAERVERGARWVKVFADFTSDFGDKTDPGFTEDDAVTYEPSVLREAASAVHDLGGRVAAHCFTRAGAEVAVTAGVDCLEHGWGVDEPLLDAMARAGTAWAPLAGIAREMRDFAKASGDDARAAWVERSVEALARLLPMAEARGIPLLAGTDRFPAVTVADEIRQLHALGVSRTAALAAGSWAGRAYLGEVGLVDGAPADLVLYREDPRDALEELMKPELIVIGGRRVEPSMAKVRPSFTPMRGL